MELFSQRLCLRPPEISDLDFFADLYGNKETMRFIPPHGKTSTRIQAEERLRRLIAHWKHCGYGMFLLELKKERSPVGYCGFRFMPEVHGVELGYIIGQPFWGRGIASEAASRCVLHAGEDLNLESIVSVTGKDNAASQRVLAKLGFERIPELDDIYHGMNHLFFRRTLRR